MKQINKGDGFFVCFPSVQTKGTVPLVYVSLFIFSMLLP